MKDRVDRVLGQSPFDQPPVADVARDHVDALLGAFEHERRADHRVALEHRYARFARDELLDQPASEETVGAGDEDRTPAECCADHVGIIPGVRRHARMGA